MTRRMNFPDNPNRILYQATCDRLSDNPLPDWEVKVEGQPPYAHTRTYLRAAATADKAVRMGIVEFLEEMEQLGEGVDA